MALLFTELGLKRLQEKEKQLKGAVRASGAEVGEAAGINCDWHDNAGYDEARRSLEMTSTRLKEVRDTIRDAVLFTLNEQNSNVRIGNTVKVTLTFPDGSEESKEFTIGAYGETNTKTGLIAYNSPLATALMGQTQGALIEGIRIGAKPVDITIDEIFPPSVKYERLVTEFYGSNESSLSSETGPSIRPL